MTQRTDPDALGQILLVQSTVHVIRDDARLAAFVRRGLEALPGIESVELELTGAAGPATSPASSDAPDQTARIPVRTSAATYGSLILEGTDATVLAGYLPHLNNLANGIALVIENREQRRELEEARRDLERRVAQRTADLEAANRVLSREMEQRRRAEEQRRSLERQMHQAQKLECLGVLAGGIAHDFNNILSAIVGNTNLLSTYLAVNSQPAELNRAIEEAAMRAAGLCRQLLAYAGKRKRRLEKVDLNRTVRETLAIACASTAHGPAVTADLDEDIPAIRADETQMSQVVMNLVLNALEAVADGPGEVTVRTGTMRCDVESRGRWLLDHALDGRCCTYLEVQDTGCGMSRETLARIFDPFFTTKFTGRGLGLASVLGIIRAHNGTISVQSQEGQGTTFSVVFVPAAEVREPVTE